jgi:hypothetical protein
MATSGTAKRLAHQAQTPVSGPRVKRFSAVCRQLPGKPLMSKYILRFTHCARNPLAKNYNAKSNA